MEYKTSAAQRRANYNYDETHERVNCRFAKGTKERIKALKYSVNDFIKLAVVEKLEREEQILKKGTKNVDIYGTK